MSDTTSPNLTSMIAQYLEKTGSLSVDMQNIINRAVSFQERSDRAKEASFGATKDRAEQLAHRLSQIRLPSGHALVEGVDSVKTAAMLLSQHDTALSILDIMLDEVAKVPKTAEIGWPASGPVEKPLTALEELSRDLLGSRA